MKIRMLVDMPAGGARNGEPWPARGESFDAPTADAVHLIASGVAEEVSDDTADESETEQPAPDSEPLPADPGEDAEAAAAEPAEVEAPRRGRRRTPDGEG